MPTGSDARQRRGRLAAEDGSASVEFLGLSVILLVPLVYLMVFASQIQAAAFGAVAAADQVAAALSELAGGRPPGEALAALALLGVTAAVLAERRRPAVARGLALVLLASLTLVYVAPRTWPIFYPRRRPPRRVRG